ncbi:DUF504 domain-containing protein [Candidatus Woesearchaeota archaeon]|nr:DUF504 domain-containing protein [Candidatus Woesearchaeota archaeon]
MQYIADLINKIKWDENENPEDYVIGYEDRISKKIVEIKFTEIKRIEGNFMVLERDLEEVDIPMHRIRVVKKQGNIVWERAKAHEEP